MEKYDQDIGEVASQLGLTLPGWLKKQRTKRIPRVRRVLAKAGKSKKKLPVQRTQFETVQD